MNETSYLRTQLIAILVLLALSIMFWNSIAVYPVKLFVVVLHELSHGLTAILTGGSIARIEIDPRIGGTAYTQGGWQFAVASSGYLGSMILGGLILLLALRPGASKPLGWTIGVVLIGITILFVRNTFGFVFCLGFGIALILAMKLLPQRVSATILQYLGAMSCLYALIDIKEDLFTLETRQTDAAMLAGITGIPAIVWAVLWAAAAVAVCYVVMRKAFRKAWE